jgi:hypothetical protein
MDYARAHAASWRISRLDRSVSRLTTLTASPSADGSRPACPVRVGLRQIVVRRIDAAAESARSVLSAFARPGCDRPAGVDWQPRTLTTHQHLSRALEPPTGIDGSPRTAKPLGVRLIRLQRGLPHAGTDRHASMLVLGMPANTAHPRAARVRSSLPTSHVVGGGAQKAFWTARDGFNRPLGDDGGLGSCADIVRREPMASRSLWNLLREPTGLPTLPPHLSRHPGARPRPRGRRASSRRARLLFDLVSP